MHAVAGLKFSVAKERSLYGRLPSVFLTCPVSAAGSDGRRNTFQCVDATTLPGENWSFWLYSAKPSQGRVPAGLTYQAISAFVFTTSWLRVECCIDQ
jgi:hypothetical protein